MNLLFCIHTVTSGVRKPGFRDRFRYGFISKHFAQQTSNTQEQICFILVQFIPSKLSLHTIWISRKIGSVLFLIISLHSSLTSLSLLI